MKKVTLEDIAKACGITKGAVSRALADKYNVGVETTYLVKQKAIELGYNFKKLKISKSQNKKILILCPSRLFFKENFWISITKSISDRLSSRGIKSEYFIFEEDELESSLDNIKNAIYKGYIVIHYNVKSLMDTLVKQSLPTVVIDPKYDSNIGTLVKFSNFESSFKATELLISRGHKKIAFYGSNDHSTSFRERYNGFISCVSCVKDVEHKELIFDNSSKDYADNEKFKKLIKEFNPSAVVCANDLIAINAYKIIKALGLNIPNDVSLVGFDNVEESINASPKLSTFDIPLNKIGVTAADYIINVVENDVLEFSEIVVRCEFIERDSIKKG